MELDASRMGGEEEQDSETTRVPESESRLRAVDCPSSGDTQPGPQSSQLRADASNPECGLGTTDQKCHQCQTLFTNGWTINSTQ